MSKILLSFLFVFFASNAFAGDIERVDHPKYPGFMYKPKGISTPLPGIIILHGSEGWGDYWGDTNIGENAPAPSLAKKFAEAGYISYAPAYFDSRHPDYDDIRIPKELAFINVEQTYLTMRWFKQEYVQGNKLILAGASRGAEQVLLLASLLMNSNLVPEADRVLPDLVLALSPSYMVQRGISDSLSVVVYGENDRKHRFDMLPAWRWGETMNSPGSDVRTYPRGFQFNFERFPNKILISHFTTDPIWGAADADLSRLIATQPQNDVLDAGFTTQEHNSGDYQRVLEQVKNSGKNRIFVSYPDTGHSWNRPYQIQFLLEAMK